MTPPWINYNHLMKFRAVGNLGSTHAAAIELRVQQAAVWSQLKELQETLGVQLVRRKGEKREGMELTEAGAIALEYANAIHALGEKLLREVCPKGER